MVAWGANGNGQSAVPAGLSGVVAVAAGNYHSLALKADGTVVAWGDNEYGQSATTGLRGAVAVSDGHVHSLAVVAVPPTVSNLSPASGPAAGGGTVVITGSRFTRVSGVSFGSKPASAFTVDSDTQITATVPPGRPGPVHVMVAAPVGVADISARDVYTYNGGNLYVTAWGRNGTYGDLPLDRLVRIAAGAQTRPGPQGRRHRGGVGRQRLRPDRRPRRAGRCRRRGRRRLTTVSPSRPTARWWRGDTTWPDRRPRRARRRRRRGRRHLTTAWPSRPTARWWRGATRLGQVPSPPG